MRRESSARRIFFPENRPHRLLYDQLLKIDKPRITSSQVFVVAAIKRI
jgi:hypothetical protein